MATGFDRTSKLTGVIESARLAGVIDELRGSAEPVIRGALWHARQWVNVRAGNPAVVDILSRRPEALRPHLSVSLPLKRPLLCIAPVGSASQESCFL
jgi:hypothetical protein